MLHSFTLHYTTLHYTTLHYCVREVAVISLVDMAKFNYDLIYPLKATVLRELVSVLDDNKKKVRLLAAKARNTWYLLSNH